MAAKVYLSQDGYSIKGLEPPGLRKQPEAIRLMFWGWVLDLGLKAKDRDLARGIGADGKPLRRITAQTRKHRKSAMTPTGKGDPTAPPLEPGRQKSRTRSLLTGKAFADRAEFWWKFDAHTGGSWARVLEAQRDQGRDVFGLGPQALKRVMAQAWEKYRRWEAGKPVPAAVLPKIALVPPVGAAPVHNMPNRPGGFGINQWTQYFRQPAKVTIPGRPGTNYNRLLGHVWGQQPPPAGGAAPKPAAPKPKPPAPKPTPKAAPKPVPKPKPPAPQPKPIQKAAPAPAPKPAPAPAPKPAPPPAKIGPADLYRYAAGRGHELEIADADEMRRHTSFAADQIPRIPLYYSPVTRKIYLNRSATLFAAPDVAAVVRKQAEDRWWASGDPFGLVEHEIGHALHREAVGYERYMELSRGKPDGPVAALIREHVSAYAATAYTEFVAEVHAGLKAGKSYVEAIMDLYRSLGGVIP